MEQTLSTDGATIVGRYDAELQAPWRITYDHDGQGTPVLVITFGPVIPSDPALMQIRAMSGAPRYRGASSPYYTPGDPAPRVAEAYDRGYREGMERARELQGRGLDPELWDGAL